MESKIHLIKAPIQGFINKIIKDKEVVEMNFLKIPFYYHKKWLYKK